MAQSSLGHLPLAVALPVAELAQSMGLPTDQLLFVVFLLVCIPLGWLWCLVPGQFAKHTVSLALGFIVVYGMIGWGVLHLLITSLIAYFMVENFLPSGKNKSPEERKKDVVIANKIGTAVFVFSMGYLCVSHIYRQITDYLGYSMDFTAPQMVATLKFVSYAWSRVDGEAMNAGESLGEHERENAYRAERAMRERPSLLKYLAWMFFFPAVFAGPYTDYTEYERRVSGEAFKQYGLNDAPFPFRPALQKLFYALCCYPGIIIAGKFPIFGYVNSDAFYENTSVWYRIGYVTLFVGLVRWKYYFAWYLAEAGCIASGLGLSKYDPKTKQAEWEGVTNCHALRCETSCSVKDITTHWNIRTSEWLKHYVYFRVSSPAFIRKIMSHSAWANICTKFTSAFWHGFYPGYYLFFLQIAAVQLFEAPLRAVVSIYLSPESLPFKVFMCLYTMGSFAWLGASFVILEFGPSIRLFADSYFFYHIIGAILCFGVFPIILKIHKKGDKKKKADEVPNGQVSTKPEDQKVESKGLTKPKAQ